jgi:hypothetical protein
MIERIAWGLLALLHVVPALALGNPALIGRLYGVDRGDPAFLLLQHRAALFLAVVLLCVWAIFDPAARRPAVVVVAISMLSFLALFWIGGSPAALRSIAIMDLIGVPVLAYVAWRAYAAA